MDLDLGDALALWWAGEQLTGHTVYGAPVLWLGRAGKLLAFVAGCTIVLDLIGSERLMAWSRRAGEDARITNGVLVAVAVLATWAVVGYQVSVWVRGGDEPVYAFAGKILVIVLFWLLGRYSDRLARWVGGALARVGIERWVRIVAVPLFAAGFALDLLAS